VLYFGPYKILPIFYCNNNKGSRGENILRNLVGDKGGLGPGWDVGIARIMCNNTRFPSQERNFFRHLDPHPRSDDSFVKKNSNLAPNTSKIKLPQNWVIVGGCNNYLQ